jgi:hypothetical protein
MPKLKIVQIVRPLDLRSGPDVGIALQILYDMVPLEDAGYDLFDDEQLARLTKHMIEPGAQRFNFTLENHPIGNYHRVCAEEK